MYGYESWTIKKAEHQRIDAFELCCWWRLLRVPWTARRSNQPFLKDISPEYLFEGFLLKLTLQYFGHLMGRIDSFEKTLMLGNIEVSGRRGCQGWDGWMSSLTQWAWVWVSPGSCWWIGRPGVPHSMGLQRVRHAWATKLNWTEPNPLQYSYLENPMHRGAWQPTVHKSQNVRHDWTSDYAHTVFGISGSASACSTWQVQRLLFMLCYISVFCFKILQYL